VDLVIRADRAVMLMTECTGLWRRTLLIDSDGSQDIGTGVAWLQGITAFVDTRGFAGRLNQHGDVFEWQRLIDIEPPGPFPDAGRMRWEASVLIEVGVHQDYVEHWVRQAGPAAPCWALFVQNAILMRAGAQFGWADRSGVVLDTIGGPQWTALHPHVNGDDLVANGVRWSIEDSEGDVDL
jgi:hypothetical protein